VNIRLLHLELERYTDDELARKTNLGYQNRVSSVVYVNYTSTTN